VCILRQLQHAVCCYPQPSQISKQDIPQQPLDKQDLFRSSTYTLSRPVRRKQIDNKENQQTHNRINHARPLTPLSSPRLHAPLSHHGFARRPAPVSRILTAIHNPSRALAHSFADIWPRGQNLVPECPQAGGHTYSESDCWKYCNTQEGSDIVIGQCNLFSSGVYQCTCRN